VCDSVKFSITFACKLAIALVLLACQSATAQTPNDGDKKLGTICVLPNSAERPQRYSPGGDYNPDTLTIGIDQREPILWPHKETARIDGLDLNKSHRVVLSSDGKPFKAFWFRFSAADNAKLCMSYDGYLEPQLTNTKDAPWCKCGDAKTP
jgi:hypothetical protein